VRVATVAASRASTTTLLKTAPFSCKRFASLLTHTTHAVVGGRAAQESLPQPPNWPRRAWMQPASVSGPHLAQQNAEIHAVDPRSRTKHAEQELDQMLAPYKSLRAALARLSCDFCNALQLNLQQRRWPEDGRKVSMLEERFVSMWPRRMAADFRGLEGDEALLRNASAYTLALTLGAFPALLMPLPAATQTLVATVALTLYQGAASRSIAQRAGVRGDVRSGVLSVAIFRGSANANTERLAALLSLDARRFAVSLYTTQLARGDAEQLRRATEAHGRRWHHTPLTAGDTDGHVAELLHRRRCDVAL
jgi:hypothetical protein